MPLVGGRRAAARRSTTCSTTAPRWSARGRILGVVPEDLPAELPRVLRGAPVHPGRQRPPRPRSTCSASRRAVRQPACCSRLDEQPLLTFHVEICEDLWVPIPPSSYAALAGATVLLNLSASNITVGKADYRHQLVAQPVGALPGRLPLLGGRARRVDHRPGLGRPRADLRERRRCSPSPNASPTSPQLVCAEIDLERLAQERMRQTTFGQSALRTEADVRARSARVHFALDLPRQGALAAAAPLRALPLRARPTRDAATSAARRSTSIQVQGLAKRLQFTGIEQGRHRRLRRPRLDPGAAGLRAGDGPCSGCRARNILAYTMPGFATSERTLRAGARS